LILKSPYLRPGYKNLSGLDIKKFNFKPVELTQFSEEEKRQIVFKALNDEDKIHHVTDLAIVNPDYRSVVGYFTQTIQKDLRLVSGYDVLYGKVKDFVANELFGNHVELEDMNVLRNLSEVQPRLTII
jgi:type III restriction enzyme